MAGRGALQTRQERCGVYLPDLEQPPPWDAPQEMVKLRSIKDDRAGRHISAPDHVFHLIHNVCWRILHCTDSEPRVKDPAAVFWYVKGDRCSLVRIKTDYSRARICIWSVRVVDIYWNRIVWIYFAVSLESQGHGDVLRGRVNENW